jgi:Holliday junction resolvasome RuvABC endonuclease subunit
VKRAAVVVYHAIAHILVRDDDATIVERTFPELGRIVCKAHRIVECPTCTEEQTKAIGKDRKVLRFERDISAADVAQLVSSIAGVIREHQVDAVAFEEPSGAVERERGLRVLRALQGELVGLPVVLAPMPPDVKLPRDTHASQAVRVRAAALLGAPVEAGPMDLAEALEASVSKAPTEQPAQAPQVTETPPAPKQGPRIAGIDPGSHWVAVAIGEGSTAPLRFIAARTFEVGRKLALKTPKQVKRADGSTSTIAFRRVITDEDMDTVLAQVVTFLHEHEVDAVVVERATHFMRGAGDAPHVSGARAASLLRAQWVGGELAGALRAVRVAGEGGLPRRLVATLETASSRVWRAHVQKATKGASMKDAVRAAWGGTLPAQPGEHVIDAAGVAAWGVRGKAAPRTPREAGAAPPKKHEARHAATMARRREAGCSCEGTRHASDCPVQLAANAKRAAAAKGNQNRAKTKPAS